MTYDDGYIGNKTPRQHKIRLINTAEDQSDGKRTGRNLDENTKYDFDILAEDINLVQREICNMIQLENSKH